MAHHMLGSRDEAILSLCELAGTLNGNEASCEIVAAFARHLESSMGRKARGRFDALDDILRDDITRPIDRDLPGIDGDVRRVPRLLWELKRQCLTIVLSCLPPGVRIAFVFVDILGYSEVDTCAALGIGQGPLRIRLVRARKRLGDYLSPRCQHLDRQNPCNCEGRLAVALTKEFIRLPIFGDVSAAPHDERVEPDVRRLYARLPSTVLSQDEVKLVLSSIR